MTQDFMTNALVVALTVASAISIMLILGFLAVAAFYASNHHDHDRFDYFKIDKDEDLP
jgi:phage/plasmid primase-like uncharacterized protein